MKNVGIIIPTSHGGSENETSDIQSMAQLSAQKWMITTAIVIAILILTRVIIVVDNMGWMRQSDN